MHPRIHARLPYAFPRRTVGTRITSTTFRMSFHHILNLKERKMNTISDLIKTHTKINDTLCGKAVSLEKDFSRVELVTTGEMAVDIPGLVHGGFIFGLADYAAMIAVNHPNVVLGAANVKFIKPVRAGEVVVAEAKVELSEGIKQVVKVTVKHIDKICFKGEFTCFILDKHVLD